MINAILNNILGVDTNGGTSPTVDSYELLLESGDALLLENGGYLLLENTPVRLLDEMGVALLDEMGTLITT